MGGTELEKRRNKDKKRGEKHMCRSREDENAPAYIPLQEGSKTTGNMTVSDFRERNVGVETRTAATGGREGDGQAGWNERAAQ